MTELNEEYPGKQIRQSETMEKEHHYAYMSWVYLGILVTIFNYYSATARKIVYRISNLSKSVVSKLFLNKFQEEEIIRYIELATEKLLIFIYHTARYLLDFSTNVCFGIVIILLIVKHSLRGYTAQDWKYYSTALF
ncbi:uncharacterized protein LOC115891501 [Sitophilus oryzae]|uniref:Uncharacterized protein LOC115891501 n=1 Tax=Sitophilus oryzae TaxID=7048 RepID=A0A6J2YX53_SITOR|nr:uncharacterized protein LOC115891501 [Sitophilus oryzae]